MADRIVGVRFEDEDGNVVAEFALRGGVAVATEGADSQLAMSVSHGIVLDGPYATSARHIGAAHGLDVPPGRYTQKDGGAYLVALLATHWHHHHVRATPITSGREPSTAVRG